MITKASIAKAAVLLLCLNVHEEAIAAIYKCKDSEGKITFQARQCDDAEKEIKTRIGVRSDVADNLNPLENSPLVGRWFSTAEQKSFVDIFADGRLELYMESSLDHTGQLKKVSSNSYSYVTNYVLSEAQGVEFDVILRYDPLAKLINLTAGDFEELVFTRK